MRKNTHKKAFYYTFKSGLFIYTARPKRRGAEPENIVYIKRTREAIKKENDRVNALIESLKADVYKTRSREEHDRPVYYTLIDHILWNPRLNMVPTPKEFW